MLVTMRKAIQKGLLQFVAWLTVISMLLATSADSLIQKIQYIFGIEDYVLSVNGYKLNDQDYMHKEMEINRLIQKLKQESGPFAGALLKAYGIDEKNPQEFILKQAG